MKTKIKFIIPVIAIIALIITIIVITHQKKSHSNTSTDNVINVIYNSGKNHADAYIEVSAYIMQSAKGHASKDVTTDWKDYYNSASNDMKDLFDEVFNTEQVNLTFWQGDESISTLYYVFPEQNNGKAGLMYIEDVNDANVIKKIDFFNKYGIVEQINEHLYAYQYELPRE